ncbi:hypothetical protein BC831DRAFT_440606 [Entophlyctis helioformis]|nr:hypothetical protein BC831DRAFT_440606 [Entophlyctis helioformis]
MDEIEREHGIAMAASALVRDTSGASATTASVTATTATTIATTATAMTTTSTTESTGATIGHTESTEEADDVDGDLGFHCDGTAHGYLSTQMLARIPLDGFLDLTPPLAEPQQQPIPAAPMSVSVPADQRCDGQSHAHLRQDVVQDAFASQEYDDGNLDQDLLDQVHQATQMYFEDNQLAPESRCDHDPVPAETAAALCTSTKLAVAAKPAGVTTDFVFASGRAAVVDRESHRIGQMFVNDQDDLDSYATHVVRSKVDPSRLASAFARPMVLQDVSRPCPPVQVTANSTFKGERPAALTGMMQSAVAQRPLNAGFTTGSGKPIAAPSREAAQRAARLLDGVVSGSDAPARPPADIESASTTPVGPPVTAEFVGFTTARGRVLAPPSAASLARANRLLQTPADTSAPSGTEDAGRSSSHRSAARSSLRDSSTPSARSSSPSVGPSVPYAAPDAQTPSNANPDASAFLGFKSASGRLLPPPSEDARRKSEALFSGVAAEPQSWTLKPAAPVSATPISSGFTTGSGRKLAAPSARAMKVGARLLDAAQSPFGQGQQLQQPRQIQPDLHLQSPVGLAIPTHWTTPSRPALRNKNVLSLSSLRRPHDSQTQQQQQQPAVHVSHPNLHTAPASATAAPSGMRNSPFKMPTMSTPLARRTTLHPHAFDSMAAGSSSASSTPGSGLRTRSAPEGVTASRTPATKPSRQPLVDLSAFGPHRPTLRSWFGDAAWPSAQDLLQLRFPYDVLAITSRSASDYMFGSSGVDEARSQLIAAGAVGHLPRMPGICRRFPASFAETWTFANVVHQLKYRYETEINQVRSSALKSVIERDDMPSKHMVLCVSDIFPDGSIEVTDGWYHIRASLDDRLRFLVGRQLLAIGHKIHVQGAQLGGSAEAQPAVEVSNNTILKLHANGVQRAPWDARLGYTLPQFVTRGIHSLVQSGGIVACIDVLVARRYPTVYYERLADGSSVTLNEREETASAAVWETAFSRVCGQALQEVQQEQRMAGSVGNDDSGMLGDRVNRLATERLEPRSVRKYVRLLVCDYPPKGVPKSQTRFAVLTVWNDDDGYLGQFQEGKRFKFFQLGCSARSGSSTESGEIIRLNMSNFSRFQGLPADPQVVAEQTLFEPRRLVRADQLDGCRARDEMDMLGYVLGEPKPGPSTTAASSASMPRLRYQMLCTDSSLRLFVVELLTSVRVGDIRPSALLWFKGLEYVYFDANFQTHKLKATTFSDVRSASRMQPFGAEPRQDLEAWLQMNRPVVEQLRAQHGSLLSDMSSWRGS